MKIPTFTSEAVPTSETGQSFTIPGQRQVAFEYPKTEEVSMLAKAKVGEVLVDIAEKMREANDVDEINKLKSKSLEDYTNTTMEIQSPEFQKNNPMEPGEDLMAYYDRHRKERSQAINDKRMGEFNGSYAATKRAKEILSDYDSHNNATITSFARAKKIEQMEFNLVESMDNNSRAAVNAYASGDMDTYGKAIENAKTAIESNIAAGVIAAPRGEAMLKGFEKDVAVGVMSSEIDKALTDDLNNLAPNKEVPDALTGLLAHIDKGSDPYLQDPRLKADMRNLVEAKISRYESKYETYMRQVREEEEIRTRQQMEGYIDRATELKMSDKPGSAQEYIKLSNGVRGMLASKVKNKVMSASQAQAYWDSFQKEGALSVYDRQIDDAKIAGNKDKLNELYKKFSAKPSSDEDPLLDEPVKRQLRNSTMAALQSLEGRQSAKDYVAEGEAKRLIQNSLVYYKRNGEPSPEHPLHKDNVANKIYGSFSEKGGRAEAIVKDYEDDVSRAAEVGTKVNLVLKGGTEVEQTVVGKTDEAVANKEGTTTYKDAVVQQEVKNAVAGKHQALNKDSLSYTYEVFDRKPMNVIDSMGKNETYDKVYATELLSLQKSVGTKEDNLRVLTLSESDAIAAQLKDLPAEQAVSLMNNLQNYFGDHWDIAKKNLIKSKLPNELHVAMEVKNPKDANLIVNVARADKKQIANDLKYEGEQDMLAKINKEMEREESWMNFKKSIRLGGNDANNTKIEKDYGEAIENLTIGYLRNNKMSVSNAVGTAVAKVLEDNYQFSGMGFRAPAGLTLYQIEVNAKDIKYNLTENDLFDNGSTYKNKEDKKIALKRIQRDGYFVNAPDDSGLILMSSDGYVATWNEDKTPKIYTWEELGYRKPNLLWGK
jgi:hypothetical protein